MYRLEVVYGVDENGDCFTSALFENLISPDEKVPPFHKMGLAGEAQVFALADTFELSPPTTPKTKRTFNGK